MSTPERPRSRRAHQAAVEATVALLGEGRLAAATTNAVAARSGVSKATIYKHWPNRLALAVEAFTRHMTSTVAPPDTEQDLRAHLQMVARFYSTAEGRFYAELLAAGVSDPAGADLLRREFLDRRRELVLATWRRGVERGDIDPGLDFQPLHDALFGPIIFRLVSGHAPLDADEADRNADVVLRGVLSS